jgi:cytochrome c oxidase subunit 3
MAEAAPAAHLEHFSSAAHQADTAIDGTWLFLASEMLFFGGLVLVWLVLHRGHPAGFAMATAHTNLLIGSVNTLLLISASAVYAVGLKGARAGRIGRILPACAVTGMLGVLFLGLKVLEWWLDVREGLFPGAGFGLHGPDAGGAELFFSFYWVATGLHGAHMLIGVGLVAWIGWRARRSEFSRGYHTPVEAVGLYWSFVDLAWIAMYSLIYVAGRA